MGVETSPQFPDDLDKDWPLESDTRRQGAQHMRGIKQALINSTADLSGVPTGIRVLDHIYPLYAFILVWQGDTTNPGNWLGGTWIKSGQVAVTQPPASTDPGAVAMDQLWVWQRTG